MVEDSGYKMPKCEKLINYIIKVVFYYRLLVVFFAIIAIIKLGINVYDNADASDKFKNLAIVLTGGSIIMGIFYSIINYEHNHVKFMHDKKSAKDTLTYNTACKMHDTNMLSHSKNVKLFYLNNKELFIAGKHQDISDSLSAQEETRMSFLALFNYFEGIAIAIDQGIIDEVFMKRFFNSVFRDYYNYYDNHFVYIRKENKSSEIFINFTNLASNWIKNP